MPDTPPRPTTRHAIPLDARVGAARPDEVRRAGRDLGWSHTVRRVAAGFVWRLVARIAEGRRRMHEEPEAGYSTEAVLVTALLVVLAIAVIAIIAVKVIEVANGITLG